MRQAGAGLAEAGRRGHRPRPQWALLLALTALPGLQAANETSDLAHAMQILQGIFPHNQPVAWAKDEKFFADFAAAYPHSPDARGLVADFMYEFESTHSLADSAAAWSAFNDCPNEAVAEDAKAKAGFYAFAKDPIELTYTAVDGRKVDLRELRGKVVLLDFWATWCPPCLQELPNVVKTYQQYHDQGFEIVGISCDVAPDRAGASGKSWAKTGPELIAFTQAHAMPWPQSYEGRKHNEGGNTLAARFAVTGIPATFLLGKDGRIAATNVLGDDLPAQVARLLK